MRYDMNADDENVQRVGDTTLFAIKKYGHDIDELSNFLLNLDESRDVTLSDVLSFAVTTGNMEKRYALEIAERIQEIAEEEIDRLTHRAEEAGAIKFRLVA
jgi:DNA integrity scanning protein DisA with diadenylate cyclase activity